MHNEKEEHITLICVSVLNLPKKLFHVNNQIHVGVDSTIDMVITCCYKWPYLERGTGSNIDITYSWCIRFCFFLLRTVGPLTIGNNVITCGCIDEVNTRPFVNSDLLLDELA